MLGWVCCGSSQWAYPPGGKLCVCGCTHPGKHSTDTPCRVLCVATLLAGSLALCARWRLLLSCRAYHERCVDPPLVLADIPEDEGWLCPACDTKVGGGTQPCCQSASQSVARVGAALSLGPARRVVRLRVRCLLAFLDACQMMVFWQKRVGHQGPAQPLTHTCVPVAVVVLCAGRHPPAGQ